MISERQPSGKCWVDTRVPSLVYLSMRYATCTSFTISVRSMYPRDLWIHQCLYPRLSITVRGSVSIVFIYWLQRTDLASERRKFLLLLQLLIHDECKFHYNTTMTSIINEFPGFCSLTISLTHFFLSWVFLTSHQSKATIVKELPPTGTESTYKDALQNCKIEYGGSKSLTSIRLRREDCSVASFSLWNGLLFCIHQLAKVLIWSLYIISRIRLIESIFLTVHCGTLIYLLYPPLLLCMFKYTLSNSFQLSSPWCLHQQWYDRRKSPLPLSALSLRKEDLNPL